MTDQCSFPGCENGSGDAAYCEECRGRVVHNARPPQTDPMYILFGVIVTAVSIALLSIGVLMYWRVL